MRRFALALLLPTFLAACGGGASPHPDASLDAPLDGFPDAATDAPLAPPLVYEAMPDPAESTGCLATPPAAGRARAKHMECAEEGLPGSVAMARPGDILLENAFAKFIVKGGAESASTIGAYAGGIVDAAAHGSPDLLKEVFVGLDLGTAHPTTIAITDAGGDHPARVRVVYELDELSLIASVLPGGAAASRARGVIDYELRPDERALRITVRVTPTVGTSRVAGRPTLFALLGGAAEPFQPGTGALSDDALGGSVGPELLAEGGGSALALRMELPAGGVTHIDSINILQASERVAAAQGEDVVWEARLAVAPDAATAQGAARAEVPDLVPLTLTGDAPRVEVRDADGDPVLRTTTNGPGAALLPPGAYAVVPGFGRFFPGAPVAATLAAPGASLAAPAPPMGVLRVTATADGADDAPVRVTAVAPDGEELVRFVVVGTGEGRLPPGDATVTVSRGLEHDIHQEDVTVPSDGGVVEVTAALPRMLDTTGWVAGDFHLHSEMSTDSTHAVPDAVRIVAAEGLEVVAATDHDFVNDYRPFLAEAGLDSWVLAMPGEEVSHTTLGHINGYPLARDPDRAGGGALAWFDLAPPQIFAALRTMGDASLGAPLVQLNHPHLDGAGWLGSIAFDPGTGMAGVTAADLGLPETVDVNDFGFDVIEAWNMGPSEADEVSTVDVLGFWALGRRVGMVGNSDSHEPESEAGSPRTFVAVADDRPGAFTWAEVAASMRAARMTVSGGAFVTATVEGPVAAGVVPVRVRVQAPPWVELESVRVFAGRDVVIERALDPAVTDALRFDETLDVPLGGATFVLARADGSREPAPVIGHRPFGITNPVPVE